MIYEKWSFITCNKSIKKINNSARLLESVLDNMLKLLDYKINSQQYLQRRSFLKVYKEIKYWFNNNHFWL